MLTAGSRAVVIGVVTDGWLKGILAPGKYTRITCGQAPSGTRFDGAFDILQGSESGD